MVAPEDSKGRMQAILLLMEVNRGIYADCPEVPSFGQRFATMLRRIRLIRQSLSCNKLFSTVSRSA